MRGKVQLHPFARGYPVFPALFVEKTILSLMNGLGTLVKNDLTTYASSLFYFWALYSSPLVYVSVFNSHAYF